MDLGAFLTVWGLIGGAILLAGGMGILFVWRKKNERNELFRFLFLLLIGLTFVLLLVAYWPLALLFGTGAILMLLSKAMKRAASIRKTIQKSGYSMDDVEFSSQQVSIGFCTTKLAFFEAQPSQITSISEQDFMEFYFLHEGDNKAKYFVSDGEIFSIQNQERYVDDDFFSLVIQGQSSIIGISGLDVIEVIDASDWVKSCISRW